MSQLIELLPWLIAMAALVGLSAFFSANEAAFFSLRLVDRRLLAEGGSTQRVAAKLLEDPDRLLTAVLFWNLVINMTYFAISSIVSLRINEASTTPANSLLFGAAALLAMIFLSEMLPKSLGVLRAMSLVSWTAGALNLAVRIVEPLMPLVNGVNLVSQRLVWPKFRAEPYLDSGDLERAIDLSTHDAALIEQEKATLRNIVSLSEIRADEWMRPRTQFLAFRPPVHLASLQGRMTPSGYLLISEADSEEIVAALHLKKFVGSPDDRIDTLAQPVVVVPWCVTVADVLERMQQERSDVAAVVNEFGETIGILSFEDILDTLFTYSPSRSKLLLDRKPIHDIGPGEWIVAGVTSLGRLSRYLQLELPPSKSVTVAGVIQEQLHKLAEEGDHCEWGPFHLSVVEAPQRGHMLIRIVRQTSGGGR